MARWEPVVRVGLLRRVPTGLVHDEIFLRRDGMNEEFLREPELFRWEFSVSRRRTGCGTKLDFHEGRAGPVGGKKQKGTPYERVP